MKTITIFCENGCGNIATYQTKTKKWMCNKDHRKCPVNKLKYGQLGSKNGMFGKKHSDKTKIKIGLKGKNKKGNFKPETIELLSKLRSGKGNPRYGVTFKHKQDTLDKIRKTNEDRGNWNKQEFISDYERYKKQVYHYTNISILKKFTKEQLVNRGRLTGKNIHIDHIFSIVEGFNLNIDPKIIGCKSNIRILSVFDNCSKHKKSDFTKEELLLKYQEEVNNENVEC